MTKPGKPNDPGVVAWNHWRKLAVWGMMLGVD
jgi:hypothetical protein